MEKGKNKFAILDVFKFLLPMGVLGTFFVYCYTNYWISPKIGYTYGREKDIFSVQSDFRGISMRAYPQMLICYGNYVILVTHLDKYYDQEVIYFTDKAGETKKVNQDYADKLMQYIRENVLARLQGIYDKDTMEKISKEFEIYVSIIGGVQYENRRGNEIKKYCIIEDNGLVIDYEYNADEIADRLYENEIILCDDLNTIEESMQINQIIEVVTKEVVQLYEGDFSNDLLEFAK